MSMTTSDNAHRLRDVADATRGADGLPHRECDTEQVELSGYEREVIAKLRDCPEDVREAVLTLLDAIVD